MLRKAADDEGKDWDRLLPYLLFAYREVPQALTGFSPFELVYDHRVWVPLDIPKETWEASKRSTESVISYVLTIQEQLARLRHIVREKKAWYDRQARRREFQQGDRVLVLLPTSTKKLLASWSGPYPITRQISPVTYEVIMTDCHKKNRIFLVSLLQQWHSTCAMAFLTGKVAEKVDRGIDDGCSFLGLRKRAGWSPDNQHTVARREAQRATAST